MEIIIVYNDQIKNYVDKVSAYLESMGYAVGTKNINEYEGTTISTVPTFLIKKSGKEGYLLKGKQPLDVILNWAKNSGIGTN